VFNTLALAIYSYQLYKTKTTCNETNHHQHSIAAYGSNFILPANYFPCFYTGRLFEEK
jgi:hypothetical protein